MLDVSPIRSEQGSCPVVVLRGDITNEEVRRAAAEKLGGRANLILSDMSPNLSGIKIRDMARSAALVETVFELAFDILAPGGAVVAKIFPSEDADLLFQKYRANFKRFNRAHVKSSRKSSNEIYFVAQNFVRQPSTSGLDQEQNTPQ